MELFHLFLSQFIFPWRLFLTRLCQLDFSSTISHPVWSYSECFMFFFFYSSARTWAKGFKSDTVFMVQSSLCPLLGRHSCDTLRYYPCIILIYFIINTLVKHIKPALFKPKNIIFKKIYIKTDIGHLMYPLIFGSLSNPPHNP